MAIGSELDAVLGGVLGVGPFKKSDVVALLDSPNSERSTSARGSRPRLASVWEKITRDPLKKFLSENPVIPRIEQPCEVEFFAVSESGKKVLVSRVPGSLMLL